MDPEAALEHLLDAIRERDLQGVSQYAFALETWIHERNAFAPSMTPHEMGEVFAALQELSTACLNEGLGWGRR